MVAIQALRRRVGEHLRLMQQAVAAAGSVAQPPEVVEDIRTILHELREMAGPHA